MSHAVIEFRAEDMPHDWCMSFHFNPPANDDIVIALNADHATPQICDALAYQSNLLLGRAVFRLRSAS